jgi:flagellar hook-associated protein 1 FlgK
MAGRANDATGRTVLSLKHGYDAMSLFTVGVSALDVAQNALNMIGNNLANANTPGYHEQVMDLTEAYPTQIGNNSVGSGVQIADTRRIIDNPLETAITNQTFALANTTAQLNTLQQMQTNLTPSSGSIGDDIEQFFNDVNQLATNPSDTTQRTVVIDDAQNLATTFNSLSASLTQIQNGLDSQLNNGVSDINSLAGRIAQLNGEIANATANGTTPNDLLDQRGQLINQLAGDINVQVGTGNLNQVNILAGGVPLVVGNQSQTLQYSLASGNQGQVTVAGSTTPLAVTGGQVGGMLAVRNQSLTDAQTQLDTLAGAVAQQVDEVQATGLGLSGSSTNLSGTRGVNDVNVPLDKAGLAFPPQAGPLYVSVTNLSTGTRTLTAVNIDPATQSLNDVAAALSAVPNIQAVTDPQTGTLQISANPGYAFDFAGRLPSSPDTTSYTGTATPQVGGQYTGANNDTYSFQVVGSGTVGVTPNLELQVKNSAGTSIATLNIGQGYSPGTPLTVANGITVQLASGTANSGDTFSTPVIAQPDSSGILSALGLGTFFTGSTASDIAVQSALLNNPSLLAASRNGDSGDNSNLTRLAALQTQPVLANGTQTLTQGYNAIVGDVATQVQTLTTQQTSQQALGQQLQTQQQNISGVDNNEELVNLMSFQQAYQSASEYIGTVNTALQSLYLIVEPSIA